MQGDAADVLAMRFDDGPVAVIDILADQLGPPRFDPAIASQMSQTVGLRLGMRRSGIAETSLVTDLVTDLVSTHTGPGHDNGPEAELAGR